jgi:hypothetical protein
MMSNAAATGASTATAEGSNQPVSFTTSNQSGSATISNVTAVPSGSNTSAAMAGSNEVVSGASASSAATEAGSTNSAATGTNAPTAAAELPIQFQDVPMTTAIESLARLAGINYLLDPKIGYGQPDQNGQIENRDLQSHNQGFDRAAALDHPRRPAQILQHFQHDGRCRKLFDRQTQQGGA